MPARSNRARQQPNRYTNTSGLSKTSRKKGSKPQPKTVRSKQATQRIVNNVRSCMGPDGTFKDYPDLREFGEDEALNRTKITSGFESRILVDVMRALRSRCVSMLDQCKSLYPDVTPQTQYNWLTSIDQDNKVGLAHTIEQSNFPILYNTPRMCDPGITMSKNWSLTNYIETRLFLFKFKYNYGRTLESRNTSTCISKTVFDFRPFTISMRDPRKGSGKTIYIHQWIEAADNANGFESYTAVSASSKHPKANLTTVGVFERMIKQIQLTFLGQNSRGQVTVSGRNSAKPLNLGPVNQLDAKIKSFMKFIQDYDGVKFIDNSNANRILGIPNPKSALNPQSAVLLTSDVLRMFYFDMFHDEILTRNASFDDFSRMFLEEVNSMQGEYTVLGAPGKGKVKSSYTQYGSLLFPRNSSGTVMNRKSRISKTNASFIQGAGGRGTIPQIPAFIKTVGDLAQYIYAGRYDTFVASGDRIGIAVGLYVNAKLGIPVKVMIEDSITGFITYTNLKNVSFKPKMKCFGNSSKSNSCKVTTNKISVQQFSNALQKGHPNNSRKEFTDMKSTINKKLNRLKRQLQENRLNTARPRQQYITRGINNRTRRAIERSGTPQTPQRQMNGNGNNRNGNGNNRNGNNRNGNGNGNNRNGNGSRNRNNSQ